MTIDVLQVQNSDYFQFDTGGPVFFDFWNQPNRRDGDIFSIKLKFFSPLSLQELLWY